MAKMNRFLLLSTILNVNLLLPCTAQTGQGPSTYFIVPPDTGTAAFFREDPIFQLNVNTKLRWVTNETYYSIFLYQQQGTTHAEMGNPIFTKQDGDQEPGEFFWNVTVQAFSLRLSPVFFFNLGPSGSLSDYSFTSHYFNITDNPVQSTPTSSSIGSSSSIMSSTSTTAQSSTASGTSSTSSSSSTTSLISSFTTPATTSTVVTSQPESFVTVSPSAAASSSAETIGLGVGLGVGIPIALLLAALVGYAFYRRRKREALLPKNDHKLSDIVTGVNTEFGPSKEQPADGEERAELHATYLPAELSERRISIQPAELSASRGRFS